MKSEGGLGPTAKQNGICEKDRRRGFFLEKKKKFKVRDRMCKGGLTSDSDSSSSNFIGTERGSKTFERTEQKRLKKKKGAFC